MPSRIHHRFLSYLVGLGPMRIALGVLTLIMIIFAPDPSVPIQRSGWGLVSTAVIPALGPMLFVVLLLDALMSRVLRIDKTGAKFAHYRRAMWYDLMLAAALVLSWMPFILYLAGTA